MPEFLSELNEEQQVLIGNMWNFSGLPTTKKLACIEQIVDRFPVEARRKYRAWRFNIEKSAVSQINF